MIEKEIDKYVVKTLISNGIDFIHIPNKSTMGKSANYKTYLGDEGFTCTKYFSDFMFPFNGSVYMIENGIKEGNQIRHKTRKDMQRKRMAKWACDGKVKCYVVCSKEAAKKFFEEIGLLR